MTTSLSDKPNHRESALSYLARISGMGQTDIQAFFKAFEIESEFPAHQNLIEDLNYTFSNHGHDSIFCSLMVYQKSLSFLEKFTTADIKKAAPAGPNNNPVKNLSERPVAAFALMPKDRGPKNENSINTLSLLLIFAILSQSTKSSADVKNIRSAATQIRTTYETELPDNPLGQFNKKLINIYGFNELCELVCSESKSRENEAAKRLFRAISKILPLIDKESVKHYKITRQRAFIDTIDVPLPNSTDMQIFAYDNTNALEPDEGCIVITRDQSDDIYDIESDEVSKEVSKVVSKPVIYELTESLKETQNNIIQYSRSTHPRFYIENDYLKYTTKLHNPIERHWLTETIITPEIIGSDDKAALLVCLSICLGKEYSDILGLLIGDNGDITPQGIYKRKIPEAQNAINPGKKVKHLYKTHINDSKDNKHVNLPLPRLVSKIISRISADHNEDIKIKNIFENSEKSPGIMVREFIGALNKEYGQRFNSNRISCQLKQFIKSELNDPCISYALFGQPTQRAPSAYYYRTTKLSTLINIYKKLSTEYFKC